MSVSNQEMHPPTPEQINYLWDEYKYRHGLCWQAVYKIIAAVIFLAGLPYAKPELTKYLDWWVLAPPVMGTIFAVFGVFVINNELKLFSYAKVAHNQLQMRFIQSMFKEEKIREEAVENLNPHKARLTLFDIYVHVMLIILCVLSAANALLLGLSQCPVYCPPKF